MVIRLNGVLDGVIMDGGEVFGADDAAGVVELMRDATAFTREMPFEGYCLFVAQNAERATGAAITDSLNKIAPGSRNEVAEALLDALVAAGLAVREC